MEDDRKKRGGAGAITLVVAALVLVPILYVLSVGPAIWLWNCGYLSDKTVHTA